MLYDKPVWALMAGVVESLEPPLAPKDIRDWFAEHYPLVKGSTVTAHVIGLTANDPNRRFYRVVSRKPPLFFRLADGKLVFYDATVHGTYDADGAPADGLPSGSEEVAVTGQEDEDDAVEATMEFALETYLEEFLLTNWGAIDWGRPLRLYERSHPHEGHQFPTPVGRLDFLCVDEDADALVVVELKRGRPSDQVVGQIARYLGWVREHLAEERQPVYGIIVTQDIDTRLAYSASVIPGLEVMEYRITFQLQPRGLDSSR